MDRCPCCRARVRDSEVCHRCEVDLSSLLTIESEAETLFARSLHYYRTEANNEALKQVERAIQLCRKPLYMCWYQFLLSMNSASAGSKL